MNFKGQPANLYFYFEQLQCTLTRMENNEFWMQKALELAQQAADMGEVPVGALVVYNNELVSTAFNRREGLNSPIAHAELLAIEEASQKLGRWRLSGCTLYVTLEPCVMCAGAIVNSRLDRVVFGASDPKAGAVGSLYEILSDSRLNHRPDVVGGVLKESCGDLLSQFFVKLRKNNNYSVFKYSISARLSESGKVVPNS